MKLSSLLPANIIVLDLKDSELTEDPMRILGDLAHLKFLRLSNSYLGTRFTCKSGSFPRLEQLCLHNLQNLDCWEIEKGAMVNLKTLEIIGCLKLENFPQGLTFLENLEQLEFLECQGNSARQQGRMGGRGKKLRLPHKCDAIIERSDSPVDISSVQKIYEQLIVGIYLDNKQQKFWLTKQDEVYYNCFKVYASDLSLATEVDMDSILMWNARMDHWKFREIQERDGALIKAAKLDLYAVQVLGISGSFTIDDLSPNVTYAIAYVIKFDYVEVPSIQSVLALPNGSVQTHKRSLGGSPRNEWVLVPVGEFKTSYNLEGAAEFSLHFQWARLYEVEFEVKGAIIQPMSLAADDI